MNKATIAGLVAAANVVSAADVVCDGPFVQVQQAAKVKLTAAKLALDAKRVDALAAQVISSAAYDTALANFNAQEAIASPFRGALTTASGNLAAATGRYSTQASLETAQEFAVSGPIAVALAAQTASGLDVDAQQALINTQTTEVAKQQLVVTETAAELVVLEALLVAADLANTTQIALTASSAAAVVAASALLSASTLLGSDPAQSPYTGGWTAVALVSSNAATAALEATSVVPSAWFTAAAALTTANPARMGLFVTQQSTTAVAAQTAAACTAGGANSKACSAVDEQGDQNDFSDSAQGSVVDVNQTVIDAIFVIKTAAATAQSNADTAMSTGNSAHVALTDAVVTAKDAWQNLKAVQDTQAAVVVNLDTNAANAQSVTSLTVIRDANLVGVTPSTTIRIAAETALAARNAVHNVGAGDGHLAQHNTDLARGQALLDTLTAALVPLNKDKYIKDYLWDNEVAIKTAATAAKDAAALEVTTLTVINTMAQELVTRANLQTAFYQALLNSASAAKDVDDGIVNTNAGNLVNAEASIVSADAQLARTVSECKVTGYGLAQAAKLAANERAAADVTAAAAVATSYAAKSAIPAEGAGSLCGFPVVAAGAEQTPRPLCPEAVDTVVYCCGAAQKFLKDGTKLTVESCQLATGVHTYSYYPPLVADATVEPAVETWRFQCISGAQKLVAAATAALAASYMMA